MKNAMPFHPVAEMFPLMSGAAFEELVADIKANGLREDIWTFSGKIIDGRNRFNACTEAEVKPRYREWDGPESELTKFIISLNLHRRHLSESQRAMIAAKISNRPHGVKKSRPCHDGQICPSSDPSVPEAAEMLNVSRSVVRDAKRVRANCVPEVVAAVEAGEITVHAADRLTKVPKRQQVTEMRRQKLLHGKRSRTTAAPTMNGSSKKSTTVSVNIDTANAETAAAELAECLDLTFLIELSDALAVIAGRYKAAEARGLKRIHA